MTTRDQLEKYFSKGATPTAEQFAEMLKSYWHQGDTIPIESIDKYAEYNARINEMAAKVAVYDLELNSNAILSVPFEMLDSLALATQLSGVITYTSYRGITYGGRYNGVDVSGLFMHMPRVTVDEKEVHQVVFDSGKIYYRIGSITYTDISNAATYKAAYGQWHIMDVTAWQFAIDKVAADIAAEAEARVQAVNNEAAVRNAADMSLAGTLTTAGSYITALQSDLANEKQTSRDAEIKNASDIVSEITRAKTAEQKNAAAITAEAITREQAVAGMADKRLDNTGYADMLRNINGHIGTCTYNAGNPYATNPGMYIMYDGKEYKGLLFVSSNGMPTYQHVITPDGIKYRRWNNSGQMGGNWSPIWATRIDFANAGCGSSGGISATVDGWQLNISSGAIVIDDALILTAYAPIYRNNLILTT